MPSPSEEALKSLNSDDSNLIQEGLALTVRVFERTISGDLNSEVTEPATTDELAALRGRLITITRSGAPAAVLAGSVFALGKLYDPGLRSFFVDRVRADLHGDANVLYQAMIALNNLEVDVFAGRDSMSCLDVEENRGLAAAFLQEHARS